VLWAAAHLWPAVGAVLLNVWLHVPAGCSAIDAATWPAAPHHGSLSTRTAGV
jgi:hypothetical protein